MERDTRNKDFAQKVKWKIRGWYSKEEYTTKAIQRIVNNREEIISLLQNVKKYNTQHLLEYLDQSGFYYRASSPDRHHNYPGGLAEHSLGVYRMLNDWNQKTQYEDRHNSDLSKFLTQKNHPIDYQNLYQSNLDPDDTVLATICHDLCKAQYCYFVGRKIKGHNSDEEFDHGRHHSSLSAKRLKRTIPELSDDSELILAIRNHMRLFSGSTDKTTMNQRTTGRKSPLCILVWAADKIDASHHHSKGTRRSK